MLTRDRRTERTGGEPPEPRRPSADVAGRIVLLLVIAAVYARIYFGFAFFDEAYYLALPYSFSLGHRPFLDENAIHQLGALLIRPFVGIYLQVVGGNEGLVLFGRHLYLGAALAAAWTARDFWRRAVGERAGNLLAAVIIAYVPLCIFGLSYNTLTYLGLIAGTALLASACLPGKRVPRLVLATVCLAAVSFAYPTMAPVAAVALALGLAGVLRTCAPEERVSAVGWTGAAALLSAGLGGGYLIALGLPEAFDRMLEFSRAQGLQGGGLIKLGLLALELGFQSRFLVLLALVLLALVLAISRVRHTGVAALVALLSWPALALASTQYRVFHAPFTTVPYVLSLLGLLAPVVAFASRERFSREARVGLYLTVATSILAGVAILWSSANGLRNAALGFTPAAIVTLGCLAAPRSGASGSLEGSGSRPGVMRDPKLPFAVLMASLLAFQVHQLWTHAYREFLPRRLGPTIDSGPWKGIRTTRRKAEFMAGLRADLVRARADAESIIFFDYFPAGYLMSDLVPRTPGLWLFPNSPMLQGNARLRRVYADLLHEEERRPDLVVRMHCIPARPLTRLKQPEGDPVSALFDQSDYQIVVERECYSVARRFRTRSSSR